MDYELHVIIEKVSVSTREVSKRNTLKIYDVTQPKSILDLGLRHAEQISLLEKIQSAILSEQSLLISEDINYCPKCGEKLSRHGYSQSSFHAVFSDHKLQIQKYCCKNSDCNWQNTPSIKSLLGTNIHPDLARLQTEQGALYSYREAQTNLEKLNCKPRRVNNHMHVKRITDTVGDEISENNKLAPLKKECANLAKELIIQADGGHVPTKDKEKRSFEALSAIIYKPENIKRKDKHHREITEKGCVASALEDNLKSMKTYLLNGAKKQGMNEATVITALADGAKNCWSLLESLEPYCKKLLCILDWFHIGKKFQNVKNALGENFEESLDKAKWKIWHGKADEGLSKLDLLRNNITDENKLSKLNGLYDYINRNKPYIINYQNREKAKKSFTSQVAESYVGSLINARHKKTRKMQWTREAAHKVLQIRALMASNDWEDKWESIVIAGLKAAA